MEPQVGYSVQDTTTVTIEGNCTDDTRDILTARVRMAVLHECSGWLPTSDETPLTFVQQKCVPVLPMTMILRHDVDWAVIDSTATSLHVNVYEHDRLGAKE